TGMPLWPYCLNTRLLGIIVFDAVPIAVIGRPNDSGIGLPASSSNFGFGSKVSRWLGPPSRKSQITDLARGLWWGAFGASGSGIDGLSSIPDAKPSSASIDESAIEHKPALDCSRKLRRSSRCLSFAVN